MWSKDSAAHQGAAGGFGCEENCSREENTQKNVTNYMQKNASAAGEKLPGKE